jgi:hypothetical protein
VRAREGVSQIWGRTNAGEWLLLDKAREERDRERAEALERQRGEEQ